MVLDMTTTLELAKLIEVATLECQEKLKLLPGDSGKIETEEVHFHRIVSADTQPQDAVGMSAEATVSGNKKSSWIVRESRREARTLAPLERNWATVGTWPSVKELIQIIESIESSGHRDLFKAAGNTPRPVTEHYALITLSKALQRLLRPSEIGSWSLVQASCLEQALTTKGELNHYVAPLIGFVASPSEPINILPALRVRPVSEDETDDISMRRSILGLPYRYLPPLLQFMQTDWVIECDVVEPRPGHSSGANAANAIEGVVRALRIFKDGQFDYATVGHNTVPYGTFTSGTENPWFPSAFAWSPIDQTYSLSPKDLGEAADFVRAYLAHPSGVSSEWIDLAARRLTDAYRRDLDRDKLIDSVVMMETALMRDTNQELSFRFASRGAIVLGRTPEEREKYYSLLKGAYNRRSDILHGKADPGTPSGREALPVARAVLRIMIEHTKTISIMELLRLLDRYAVSRRDGETLSQFVARARPANKPKEDTTDGSQNTLMAHPPIGRRPSG
jgi:hypothetical protein